MIVSEIGLSTTSYSEALSNRFCKLFEKIESVWRSVIHKICTYLYLGLGWRFLALSSATWLTEPLAAFEAASLYPLAWFSHPFTYRGANPTTLTVEQKAKKPILLLHGNYANPATFLPLIRSLQAAELGPIFTVSLYDDEITEADHEIIAQKIGEIRALYTTHGVLDVKVDIIGHSRGGSLAFKTLQKHQEVIDAVVRIGWISTQSELDSLSHQQKVKLYEITAKKDLILPDPSIHPFHTHRFESSYGHLGAIYDINAHQRIVSWLRNL